MWCGGGKGGDCIICGKVYVCMYDTCIIRVASPGGKSAQLIAGLTSLTRTWTGSSLPFTPFFLAWLSPVLSNYPSYLPIIQVRIKRENGEAWPEFLFEVTTPPHPFQLPPSTFPSLAKGRIMFAYETTEKKKGEG